MHKEEQQASSYTINDIYHILFRHKWKIMLFALAGLAAAAYVYQTHPRLYQSQAKVMVRYIVEHEGMGPREREESRVRTPDMRGEAMINSELEIITSMDVAIDVARAVGPEAILGSADRGNDLSAAAAAVKRGTRAAGGRRGNVITISFEHSDRAIVQRVLKELVDQYVRRHVEIHRALASIDDFAFRREEVRESLQRAEQAILTMKRTNEVFSIENEKSINASEIARLRDALSAAETDLAMLQMAAKSRGTAGEEQPAPEQAQRLFDEKAFAEQHAAYVRIVTQLELLRRKENEYLSAYTEANSMVRDLQAEQAELAKRKAQIELDNPGLLLRAATVGERDPMAQGMLDIPATQARISVLRTQLERARAEEARLFAIATPLAQLQRNYELDENKFRYYSTRLEQARVDSALGSSGTANLSRIQEPTPPALEVGDLQKKIAMAIGAGLAAGIGLALLLEMFVSQTVKRPIELGRMLNSPLYLSIPRLSRGAIRAARKTTRKLIGDGASDLRKGEVNYDGSQLQPFFDALRDRVLNRFEALTRKPKLVGVCGCDKGSGVTTIAAGLASSLAEAGDLKVLLVDMKPQNGKTATVRAKKGCGLLDALEQQTRDEAMVAPNLYLASTNSGADKRQVASPRQFTRVIPQLNASDYDYIIFDMPRVDQVSITPRLAKHMDLVLLVAEAEKVNRNTLKKANSLLLEFTPNVATILNKTRSYVPRWVSSDE
jgi:polysaccharide biosynthesis transport protein